VALAIFLTIILGSWYLAYHNNSTDPYISNGPNAVWARHQWVGEKHSPQEYQNLAKSFIDHKITDVFFHVGPLNENGLIEKEKYLFAPDLITELKKTYPTLHIQAWMGQVEKKGGGILDLSNLQTKNNIVTTAIELLDLGFDGIHYDIEPIYAGDSNFIELLQATRKITKERKKILSAATDELEPFWNIGTLLKPFSPAAGFWNEQYYQKVSANCDQVAVMMYDTALTSNWLYAALVQWETEKISKNIPPETILFMGVPTYEDKRWSFHPEAENMESGLRGIQQTIKKISPEKLKNFGVAVYAEWTTDENEWQTYKKIWLGEKF